MNAAGCTAGGPQAEQQEMQLEDPLDPQLRVSVLSTKSVQASHDQILRISHEVLVEPPEELCLGELEMIALGRLED